MDVEVCLLLTLALKELPPWVLACNSVAAALLS